MEFQSIVKFFEGKEVDIIYTDGDATENIKIIAANEHGVFTKKSFVSYSNIFTIKLSE